VLNQHRLVVDRSVVDWDYNSNKDAPPELRLLYMLFYQMSRMCKEKGAVKHDDRLDCLAQGVQYFTDCMSISAQQVIKQRQLDEWNDLLEASIEDPQQVANHLVLGFDKAQRQQARGSTKNSVPTWV
jgi:hypothetical protein